MNQCCDKADLLFHSQGIVPAGGEKRGWGALDDGKRQLSNGGKKIGLVAGELRKRSEILMYWREMRGRAFKAEKAGL